ncbi:MAG: matrixin family metalloprotease [Gemmatimonadaceae bacterium]
MNVAARAGSDSQRTENRHVDISSGSIAHAIEAVVVRARRANPERVAAKQRLQDRAVGTYINDILIERDSALTRWSSRESRPLAVWIQPRSNVLGFTEGYVDRVRDAFLQWDGLRLPVRFAFVTDSARAEVHVNWIDHFDQPISGRTRWAHDDDYTITDANIVLAVHHTKGGQLDEDSMRAMAMHEIGHLLGLDHTGDTTSIMASKVRVRELSDADRATARLLYALPAGPLR